MYRIQFDFKVDDNYVYATVIADSISEAKTKVKDLICELDYKCLHLSMIEPNLSGGCCK